MSGLLAFLVLNERGSRARRAADPEEAIIAASEASGAVVLPADPPELSVGRPASPRFLRRSASPSARRFGRGR